MTKNKMAAKRRRTKKPVDVDEQLHSMLLNGTDIEERRIYLAGEIDEDLAYRFIVALQVLDKTPQRPITVILNSCGGLCSEGWAIYDAIRFCQNDVYVIVFGQASSMGSAILQAGEKRIMAPESDFMIHNVAQYNDGELSLERARFVAHDLQRLQDRMNRVLHERSGRLLDDIKAWCKAETVFEAKSAVDLGFADDVLRYSKPDFKRSAR